MPKILKHTIKTFDRKPSLRIFKKDHSKNYYCSFYVGTAHYKSGNKEQSLRTPNVKDASKEAQELFNNVMRTLPTDKIKIEYFDVKRNNNVVIIFILLSLFLFNFTIISNSIYFIIKSLE